MYGPLKFFKIFKNDQKNSLKIQAIGALFKVRHCNALFVK